MKICCRKNYYDSQDGMYLRGWGVVWEGRGHNLEHGPTVTCRPTCI
jgi:hypothetical protein